jgi:hypothetical protein
MRRISGAEAPFFARFDVGAEAPTYKDKGEKKQIPHFVRDDSLGGGLQELKPILFAWCGTTGSRAIADGERAGGGN